MIAANVGDDFEHLSLAICPDIDTLMYTLAGIANAGTGWGRAGETNTFMTALAEIGGETWFHLGDGDLATHVERTRCLRSGETLSAVTALLCARLGIAPVIVPMSDDQVRTIVETESGDLGLQQYFVREKCEPAIKGFRYEGAGDAAAHPLILERLEDPTLGAVILCPSNPYISIDPILALPPLRKAIAESAAPVIAVSPVVGGRALKGPTVKMMAELGNETSAVGVARHYCDLLDGFVVDDVDAGAVDAIAAIGLETLVTPIVMNDLDDRMALASAVLEFAERLRKPA
tara:strand:+ start:941 stop:1807 length:867 start_codon:yes stop_codon:yes gene_type:complete